MHGPPAAPAPPNLPDLPARLRYLQSPAAHRAWSPGCHSVELIETHMSWVFIAGDHVLKLKKSVRLPFLDFSTLQAREFYCREELRLNRRLAPQVYRDLLALCWNGSRMLVTPAANLTGAQVVLDWLVLMRRLPPHRMLDRMIAESRLVPADLDPLVTLLAGFYGRQPPRPVNPAGYLQRLMAEHAVNRDLLLRPQFELADAAHALGRFERAIDSHGRLLADRATRGKVIEGHGDLRPEHVCLSNPPVIIDCLEFSTALRDVDMLDELAFLGLECAMAGAPWVGPQLIAGCTGALGQDQPPLLVNLYTAYRALLRARLAVAHLLDPEPRLAQRWVPLARRYLLRCLDALEPL